MTAIRFGRGTRAQLSTAFDAGARVIVVATAGRRPQIDAILESWPPRWVASATFTEVPQHVPREVLARVQAIAIDHDVSGAVAFGGGSPIGIVKALAIERDIRKVYIPTTFSGSEMTNIWAVSDNGQKTTARDERARADLVIYDADLVDSLPLPLVFVSLFNALAHAVEALYAPGATDDVLQDAARAATDIGEALRRLAGGDSPEAREVALRGAHHAGRALDQAQMGIHHKVAHVLGGTLGLSHSEAHTVMLPYSIAYNHDHAPEAMQRLEGALGGDPATVIRGLQRATNVPTALRDLGMAEHDVERVVDELFVRPYPNPRALERAPLLTLLHDAWAGATL